jgi:hypothetical protein
MICKGCGGILGRDCFNASECEWIAQQESRRIIIEQHEYEVGQILAELDKYKSLCDNFKKHIIDAYDQGDVDGYTERADRKKDREFKSAQEYYDKTFGNK